MDEIAIKDIVCNFVAILSKGHELHVSHLGPVSI